VADQKRSEQNPGSRSSGQGQKDSKRSPQKDQDMQRQGSSAAEPSGQGGGASGPSQQSGRQPRDEGHRNRSQADIERIEDEDEDER